MEKFIQKDSRLYYGKYTPDLLQNNVKLSDTLPGSRLNNPSFNLTALAYKPLPINLRTRPLQKSSYGQSLSFFCRKEWEFEKTTSIPLRFRLGSLEYTDYLEQKPNSARRQ